MKKILFYTILILAMQVNGQVTQTVRGTVSDVDFQFPLIGAKLFLSADNDTTVMFRTMTNVDGLFRFENVPVGKYALTTTYTSYLTSVRTIVVNSGRETIVDVELSEDVTTAEEVQVVGRKEGELNNEMALVSARQFSVEETDRYAGSRGDPARMASNFAGVQGADDSRNDIIIRGNSPIGVAWRVEGIDIPNPNHFATSGSTGGPVAILNNKILANSDFFMSAFPAEYGNSISGVFDLRLRNGNTDRHEFTGEFGLLGTQILAEGPINKERRSSYLVIGRYSTLSIFKVMGIKIGTAAVPVYGDGAFRLSFPLKKGGHIGVFGIGGASDIKIMISEQREAEEEAYGEGDRDQYFGTQMGVVGMTYKKPFSEKTYFKATIAQSYEQQHSHHDFLVRTIDSISEPGKYLFQTDSMYPITGYVFSNYKTSLYASVNHKITSRHIIKVGMNADLNMTYYLDTALDFTHSYFWLRGDYGGFSGVLVQPFFEYKWKINENMDLSTGVHSQYFSLSNSWSYAEPRIGWQWRLPKSNIISAGAGLHSQTQPFYQYFNQTPDSDGVSRKYNQYMDFNKSIHAVLGYQKNFKGGFSVKSEVYYQHLYDIPVDKYSSAFSLLNQGSGFQRFWPDELVNEGTGRNYGIELTVQKGFNRSYYFLVTGSLYESKYTGSDGIERESDYNGNYTVNVLVGKEFKINPKNTITAGLKFTTAGGKRYGYVDEEKSLYQNELIFKDSLFNTRRYNPYYRLDFKVSYRLNTKKVTHEISLDLVNIMNTKNILGLTYARNLMNPMAEPIAKQYQLGFLPIFYYRIEFTFAGRKR